MHGQQNVKKNTVYLFIITVAFVIASYPVRGTCIVQKRVLNGKIL